uniref:Putative ovule protein n=1 Tax=Solanum chacoense TaxID=4108 RepID=A0A0V0H9D7_SOLCH
MAYFTTLSRANYRPNILQSRRPFTRVLYVMSMRLVSIAIPHKRDAPKDKRGGEKVDNKKELRNKHISLR